LIRYRTGCPRDGDALAGFQAAMAKETEGLELDPNVSALGVRAVLERPELGTYHVAERAGEIVGSLLVTTEWSDWRNGFVWWIQSVYVQPASRGQGIYRGLYRHLQDLACNDPHVRGIRLYVDQRNKLAQAIYARLGMDGDHYRVFEWMKA